MQLTDLVLAIETLKAKGWQVKPPAHKSRTRIISEAMSGMSGSNQKRSAKRTVNPKRSLAAKRMWKARRKAAA
jgi:hypothetical protein